MTCPAFAFRCIASVTRCRAFSRSSSSAYVAQRQHDLVGGGVERPLAILEVEEHADAGGDQLLQRVRRLDGLPSEPGLLGHDEQAPRVRIPEAVALPVARHARRNDTHTSTTDPDARWYRTSNGAESRLAYLGPLLIENRHGLIADAMATIADGFAEREAATRLVHA